MTWVGHTIAGSLDWGSFCVCMLNRHCGAFPCTSLLHTPSLQKFIVVWWSKAPFLPTGMHQLMWSGEEHNPLMPCASASRGCWLSYQTCLCQC
jgi:hypothetical protein